MNNRIGEGHMDPLEKGAVHQAVPQGTINHGAQTSEEVQLATDRPQMNDRRKVHMQLGDVISGTGVMRAKEETITTIWPGGKIRGRRYSGGAFKRRCINGQWPQPLNLLTGLWKQFLRGYLTPMNVVKSPERFLRNEDATKTNLMAALIPG